MKVMNISSAYNAPVFQRRLRENEKKEYRQDTIQQVKFYSSAAEAPVLTVNKDTIPTRQIAPCQFISDSVVMKGRNEIVVRAGELSDRNSIVIVNALKQHQ